MPSFSAPLTIEALQDRTTLHKWNPNANTMLFFHHRETAAVETFRTLRSRLYQIREKAPTKKLLVAGAIGEEGTSFIAANLAQVMVQHQGQRALLIDGDLRQGELHSQLGAPRSPGLTEYLSGQNEEFAILQRGPMENLFFVPSGEPVSHPLELIANGRLNLLLNQLEPLFDWIIVDSAPAIAVSDAGQLAGCCDAVLLVVRSNATPSDLALRGREEFYGRKIVGVVLNGVDAQLASAYQHHSSSPRS
jgi:capsular exopolysaccharide synthesis family protein